VVSVTEFHAGSNAYNVIPPRAVLRGTIRALDTAALLNIRERVERVASSVADAHGCRLSDIQYSPDYYPPTVNDPELYNTFSEPVASMLLAKGRVREVEPTMGAEDFAFFAEAVPSTFFLLGQGGNGSASECALSSGKRSLSGEGYDPSEDRGSCEGDAVDRDPQHPPTSYGLHHPCFALDESILSLGVELHVNLALRCLKALGKRRSPPLPISSTAA
jgi:metal-dependent amidase/aminoacylase/carboxypeptidase family protein